MVFTIISAVDEEQGIGKDGSMPWHLSGDLKHFANTTRGGAVIMGRITWESIPENFRPFSDRLNIVVSRQHDYELPEGVLLASSLEEALKLSDREKTFVIGGGSLYAEAIQHKDCTAIILTELEGAYDCDTFFPAIPAHFKITHSSERFEEEDIGYRIYQLTRLEK